MFEHDFSENALLGSSNELSPLQVEEIEQEATDYGLTPAEVIELEEQQDTMDSLPPAEAEEYEQEVVATEDQQAETTMQDTMDQAESFDQTLNDD